MKRPRHTTSLSSAYLNLAETLRRIRLHIQHHKELERLSSTLAGMKSEAIKLPQNQTSRLLRMLSDYREHRIDERRFLYSTVTLLTFSTFEQFLEEVVQEHIRTTSSLQAYNELPSLMREAHLEGIANILLSRKHQKYRSRYQNWRTKLTVHQLNDCLRGRQPYQINADAFTFRTSNFRLESIRDMFRKLGVNNLYKKMVDQRCLQEVLLREFTEQELMSTPARDLLRKIDTLAERRNDVAHGPLPESLESLSSMESSIDFIESFSHALSLVCSDDISCLDLRRNRIRLPEPVSRPFNRVVCFMFCDDRDIEISIGDPIYAKKGNGMWSELHISNIQSDNADISSFTWSKDVAVGIEVNANTRKEWSYYIVT